MAIKDLAVAFNGSDNSMAGLRMAIQMCRKYNAALTGLYAHVPVRFSGTVGNWMPKEVLKSLQEADAKATDEIEAQFRAAVREQGFDGPVDWYAEEGQPTEILAKTARFYDLLLIGQYGNSGDSVHSVPAESLVTLAGKPIVIVPNGYRVRPFTGHAVVAWDASRPAARALSDAMQILETKERLDILTVRSSRRADPDLSPQHDVVRYLTRHGINVTMNALSASRDRIGPTIVDFCVQNDADVLVMGAFGHARLREDLFGGVTRHILRHTKVPVLLSH